MFLNGSQVVGAVAGLETEMILGWWELEGLKHRSGRMSRDGEAERGEAYRSGGMVEHRD